MNTTATFRSAARARPLRRPAGILASFALATACTSNTTPVVTTWESNVTPLTAQQVRGRAAAVSQAGHTDASLEIERGQAGTRYGWRIATGTCSSAGETVGGRAQYPDLTPGEGGAVSVNTSVRAELAEEGAYAVWIHLVLEDGSDGTAVACGAMERTR